MNLEISVTTKRPNKTHLVLFGKSINDFEKLPLQDQEKKALSRLANDAPGTFWFHKDDHSLCIAISGKPKPEPHLTMESLRALGNRVYAELAAIKPGKVAIESVGADLEETAAFAEGLCLSAYRFSKYMTKEKKEGLTSVQIVHSKKNEPVFNRLQVVCDSVFFARDLVNEPLSYLTAPTFSEEMIKMAKATGLKCEVFDKRKIESLKMGGLLAVNKGSIDPPTFTILEYKPTKAVNKKPLVLVGKGVVYDTGGLSLKPTPNSMDLMKSDMAGAAAVAGAMAAIARLNIPLHIIALIPATDNRPGGNAYVPGDVVTMHNGMTVEVLNTDAEGRMLLGDALSYAQKYKPMLVIDLATLTGSTARALGKEAMAVMATCEQETLNLLKTCGEQVYERMVEFPLWEEYGNHIKSAIADIKNVGGPEAGMITAGKFLEHFTDFPWVHLDMPAGSFLTTPDGYRGKGGTGLGVRLLVNFAEKTAAHASN